MLCVEDSLLTSDELLSAPRIDPAAETFQLEAEIREDRLHYLCPDIPILDWNRELGPV